MNFSLPNVDGNVISFKNYPDAKGFIVVFTCNHCPYAIAYESRLKNIHAKYAPLGYPLIAISSNDPTKYPQDSFDNMKIRATEKGFEFPYLFDESQDIARMYGAEKTPHVFLLQKTPAGLQLIYKGAVDDNYQSIDKVRTHYLADRLDSLLRGNQLSYSETIPVGCTIKWK